MKNKTVVPESAPTLTSKNIKYLRGLINLSINELGAVLKVDPIDIFQFETDSYAVICQSNIGIALTIGNFFAVPLDMLVYSDIEKEDIVGTRWVEELKQEVYKGKQANRKEFFRLLTRFDSNDSPTAIITEASVMRSVLRGMQSTLQLKNEYNTLRSKGLIEKITFLDA